MNVIIDFSKMWRQTNIFVSSNNKIIYLFKTNKIYKGELDLTILCQICWHGWLLSILKQSGIDDINPDFDSNLLVLTYIKSSSKHTIKNLITLSIDYYTKLYNHVQLQTPHLCHFKDFVRGHSREQPRSWVRLSSKGLL